MKYRKRIYNLMLNEQESLLELLESLNIHRPLEKIKNILDEELFEVIECNEYEILKIKKKSTNEIFEKGSDFYDNKYNTWITNMYFDEALFGCYIFSTRYYKNYVRGNCGLYHLDDISLTDKKVEVEVEVETIPNEIVLNGVTYIIKENLNKVYTEANRVSEILDELRKYRDTYKVGSVERMEYNNVCDKLDCLSSHLLNGF